MGITKSRMVASILIPGAVLLYFFVWRDPIFRMEMSAARNPMYYSGFSTIVRLPETASLEQVIRGDPEFGQNVRLGESRQLGPHRQAVVVESERGEKVALVQYNDLIGWFVQIRDPLRDD